MQRMLTITIGEEVYEGLYRIAGPRRIGAFIEDLVRPHIVLPDLDALYQAMAAASTLDSVKVVIGFSPDVRPPDSPRPTPILKGWR